MDLTEQPCSICGAHPSDVIPVWEEIEDYHNDCPPDYLGCTECQTMVEVDKSATDER